MAEVIDSSALVEGETIFRGDAAVEKMEALLGVKFNEVQKSIIRLEGYSTVPYYATEAEKDAGIVTIGAGQTGKIKDNQFTGFANMSFSEAFNTLKKELIDYIPDYKKYPVAVQKALMSAMYRGDLQKAPTTRRLINEGKFQEASQHFLLKGNPKFEADGSSTDWSKDYKKALANPDTLGGVITRLEGVSSALKDYGVAKDFFKR